MGGYFASVRDSASWCFTVDWTGLDFCLLVVHLMLCFDVFCRTRGNSDACSIVFNSTQRNMVHVFMKV